MSALGQSRHFDDLWVMSVLTPTTDIRAHCTDGRKVPGTDIPVICTAAICSYWPSATSTRDTFVYCCCGGVVFCAGGGAPTGAGVVTAGGGGVTVGRVVSGAGAVQAL